MAGDNDYIGAEVEISFRLDADGRTAPTNTAPLAPSGGGGDKTARESSELKRIPVDQGKSSSSSAVTKEGPILDYSYRTATATFRMVKHEGDDEQRDKSGAMQGSHGLAIQGATTTATTAVAIRDDLLLDCEIADCGLMPRTFWVPAADPDFAPRCSLEQLACDVFRYHTRGAGTGAFDAATSGAEWWVQIRPSPDKTGRYAMHCPTTSDGFSSTKDAKPIEDDELFHKGISFHWDKDEDLRLLCGGNTYVHPHLSTVTYLTSLGAPTVCLNYRVHNLTGDVMQPSDGPEVTVSFPRAGKHLSFDGRFLHAAIPEFLEPGEFERQCSGIDDPDDEKEEGSPDGSSDHRRHRRRHRRVTFLVNVWLNYKPFNVEPFPETMLEKMSGHDTSKQLRVGLSFQSLSNFTKKVVVHSEDDESQRNTDIRAFRWPMGDFDSDDVVCMVVPWQELRSAAASKDGNLCLVWSETGGVGVGAHPAADSDSDLRPCKRGRSDASQ